MSDTSNAKRRLSWKSAVLGLIVAPIAGFLKLFIAGYLAMNVHRAFLLCVLIGIPLAGSGPTRLSFIYLFPLAGAILGLFGGKSIAEAVIRKLTDKTVGETTTEIIGGIISGLLAALMFAPLGAI
jgi:hypothetical protein